MLCFFFFGNFLIEKFKQLTASDSLNFFYADTHTHISIIQILRNSSCLQFTNCHCLCVWACAQLFSLIITDKKLHNWRYLS